MATIGDSITGNENVKVPSPAELTIRSNSREVSIETQEAKVEAFLRRLLPVVSDNATNPVQALVPWVCDVLQSKQSLEVYGQDIRDFTTHMQRFGIQPHIAAVESPQVQKNTTPALTQKLAVELLHAPDISTLRGLQIGRAHV